VQLRRRHFRLAVIALAAAAAPAAAGCRNDGVILGHASGRGGSGGAGGAAGSSGGGGVSARGGAGGSAAGAGGSVAALPLDQLCGAYTTALCSYFIQCFAADFRDMNHCLAETECFGVRTLVSEVAAGAVGYDPTAAAACQARFLSDPCNFAFFITWPQVFQVLGDCPGTLTPMRHAGDPCDETRECTSDSFCKKGSNGLICPGTCTPYKKVGEACDATMPCLPGTICLEGTCAPPPQAGDACATPRSCGYDIVFCINGDPSCGHDNLWCDLGGTGTCKKGVGLGATCGTVTSNGVTTTVQCNPAFWCDAFMNQAGTCRVFGEAGAPCNSLGCKPEFHCEGSEIGPTPTLGTCKPAVAMGGDCSYGGVCASGLVCSSDTITCGPPPGLHGSCSYDAGCQTGLFCSQDAFVCLMPRYPGESCGDPDSACVHGICRAGTCVDHGKEGQPCDDNLPCVTGDSCTTSGTCKDTYVCAN